MHSLHDEKGPVRLFFENYPRQDVVSKAVSSLSGLSEEAFRDGVLRLLYHLHLSPLALRCPPPPSYRLRLLGDLIKTLESSGREVPELAYRLHGQLSAAPRSASTYGHVVYRLTETVAVPLWENRCLLAADTTGLRTWQAGKALLDWYMLRPDAIRDKRVLELGAGLGLTGLALCRLCQPKSYIITDGHPLVVQMLKYNVQKTLELAKEGLLMEDEAACARFVSDAPDSATLPEPDAGPPEDDGGAPGGDLHTSVDGTALTAGTLDWFKFTAEDARALQVDLVLTADVTYNPDLHEPLVRTLRLLLDNVQPPPEVLLALTDRNEATTARLISELAAQGLKQRLLATPANNQSFFLMDEMSKVKMFEITRIQELPAV